MTSIASGARSTALDLQGRAKQGITTTGKLCLLGYDALKAAGEDIITRRFSWEEFLLQAWFMVRVSLLPTILVAIPFGIIVSVQVGGVAGQIGATSFQGAVNGVGVLRQGAPLVTSLMIAGAVGSAITADIGARQVREEIDAMRVMGLDPVRRLVSPRVVAAIVVAVMLSAIVATTAIITGFALVVGSGDVSSGTYLGAFVSFGQPTDLMLALFKAALFGLIATVVACHKGLNASGGPKGVADAVNQSVVLSVILLAVVNVGLTQAYVMLVPPEGGLMTHVQNRPNAAVGKAVSAGKKVSDGTMTALADLGSFATFSTEAVAVVPITLKRYRLETMRQLTDIAWGSGAILVGGGTIGVMILLSIAAGTSLGIEGFNGLELIGLAPLTGFISAAVSTREIAPLIAALALAAQVGCRFTAQLGSMRLHEEIDALAVMAVQPMRYLVTTRVIAAMIAIVPLYLIGLIGSYIAAQLTVTGLFHQSVGTYLHYFGAFIQGRDIFLSVVKIVIFAFAVALIHCWYGFNASGGPQGVGEATGRAIRASIVVVVVLDMILTLLFWGSSPGFRITG